MTSPSLSRAPIAVVDFDCLFAGSAGVDEFWRVICDARSQIGQLSESVIDPACDFSPEIRLADKSVTRRCACFDPVPLDLMAIGLPPAAAAATDRSQLEALFLAHRMMERSGYGLKAQFDRSRSRIALGCGMFAPLAERFGVFLQNRRVLQRLRQLPGFQSLASEQQDDLLAQLAGVLGPTGQALTADASLGFSSHRAPGRIANRLNLRGGYTAISSSCASSAIAVLEACRWLQNGECDLALAGGTDYSMITTLGQVMFSATQAVTRGECRPFDKDADGVLGGIGCGLVLLKRLGDALRDGNPVKAVLLGGAMTADGRGTSMTLPLLDGVLRAMDGAVKDAGVPFPSLSYVEAHGTGAPAGDATELEALSKMIFAHGAPPGGLALGALKQLIGHTHASAGVAGLIKAILALQHKAIPPIRHIRVPRDFLTAGKGACYYREELTPWEAHDAPRRAMVNTLGFGGINCCLIVQEP